MKHFEELIHLIIWW